VTWTRQSHDTQKFETRPACGGSRHVPLAAVMFPAGRCAPRAAVPGIVGHCLRSSVSASRTTEDAAHVAQRSDRTGRRQDAALAHVRVPARWIAGAERGIARDAAGTVRRERTGRVANQHVARLAVRDATGARRARATPGSRKTLERAQRCSARAAAARAAASTVPVARRSSTARTAPGGRATGLPATATAQHASRPRPAHGRTARAHPSADGAAARPAQALSACASRARDGRPTRTAGAIPAHRTCAARTLAHAPRAGHAARSRSALPRPGRGLVRASVAGSAGLTARSERHERRRDDHHPNREHRCYDHEPSAYCTLQTKALPGVISNDRPKNEPVYVRPAPVPNVTVALGATNVPLNTAVMLVGPAPAKPRKIG
jgi:hypothetical protein